MRSEVIIAKDVRCAIYMPIYIVYIPDNITQKYAWHSFALRAVLKF